MIHLWNRLLRLLRQLRRHLFFALAPAEMRPIIKMPLRGATRDQACLQSAESFASLIRIYAHAIEKAVYAPVFDPSRGHAKAAVLRSLLESPLAYHIDRETSEWATNLLTWYDRRVSDSAWHMEYCSPSEVAKDTYSRLLPILQSRRSVRSFAPTAITSAHILRAVEYMRCAPTSCHRQAVRVFATCDSEVAATAHKFCLGSSGFSPTIPAFAAICTDSNPYAMPDEHALPFVDGAICAAFFILGCHAQGICATLMAWNDLRGVSERNLRELLSIPANYVIVVACALGFPAGQPPRNPRKPLSEWVAFTPDRE